MASERLWLERFPVGEGIHPKSLVIAFPGAGKSPDAWQAFAKSLPEDLELAAVHYPGRGRRFNDDIPGDIKVLASQVFDVLKSTLFTRPYVLLGHSMGSAVAAEVAMLAQNSTEALDPLGVISMGSCPGCPFDGPSASEDPTKWAHKFALEGGILSKEEAADLDPILLKALTQDLLADIKHMSSKPGIAIKSPVLAIATKDDALAPPKFLDSWKEWLAPDAPALITHADFSGGHNFHDPPIDGLVDLFANTVYSWVKNLPPSLVFGDLRKPRYEEKTLHVQFHEAAAKYAARNAIVPVDASQAITYKEYQRRVLVLAKKLCGMDVKVECICPILMERSMEFMIAIYGILSAEAAFAQVEISFPNETIEVILSKVYPSIIITKDRYIPKLPKDTYRVMCLNDHHWAEIEKSITPADEAAYANREEAGIDSLFKVPLTSGSTGIPKSIGQVHRSAVCSYHWRREYIPYEDNENEASNVFFIWEALRPFLAGSTLHIMSETCILDPHTFVDYCLERDITRMLLTPSMGETLVDAIQEESFPVAKREAFKKCRWKLLVHCGEVVSRVLQNKWLSLLPNMLQINLYSIAETYDVTCSVMDSETENSSSGLYMPAGPVMDGVTVLILRDGKDGLEIMPQNAVGDIYVAGPCLARGYLNRPEKTAEVFLKNPFKTGHMAQYSIIYKTGDIGRFCPGPTHDPRPVCEIWGRTDSVIKLRGYSIEKGAVMSAIQTYPGPPRIEWTNVFRDNCPETLRTKRIIAAILPVEGEDAGIPEAETLKNLKEWARKKLPAYAMPTMCLIDEIPISESSMKGDMKAVLNKCLEKLAKEEEEQTPAASISSFPKELQPLVEVWNEILGHPPADADTSFFEDGGHSLLAAKFVRMLSGRLQGTELAVIDLMENPTIALLAKKCGMAGSSAADAAADATPAIVWTGERPEPLAIVGLSCQFCSLRSYQELWEALQTKTEVVREFSKDELLARGWSEDQVKHPDFKPFGGPLTDDDKFDRQFFKISQHEANLMDIQQRLFIQECYTALEDAGRAQQASRPELTGVFTATWYSSYMLNALCGGGALRDPTLGPEDNHLTELGNCSEYAASRTAYLLNLRGMAVGVQTSCSSGLSTVLMGCAALHSRQLDLALTGASSATVPGCGYIAGEGVPLSQDGKTRSFAEGANGTVFTDGVAVAVLKRVGNVDYDRDRPFASMRGFALNQDGAARASFSAPGVEGQGRCLQLALQHARTNPEDVGYIECHATGTTIGDHIEVRGIARAYGKCKPLVGCGKPLIGHANLASGMAGVAKTAMVLNKGIVPGTLLLGQLNPLLGDVSVGVETQPLKKGIASVSSFGIGGTNTHAVLETFSTTQEEPKKAQCRPTWIPFLPLSAKSTQSLHDVAAAIGGCSKKKDADLVDMGRCLATREMHPKRLGIAATSADNVDAQVRSVLKTASTDDDGSSAPAQPFVALLFSGNGSYYAGLGDELAQHCCVFKESLQEARRACGLKEESDLKADALRADVAQPGLFCVQYALLRTLQAWDVPINAVVGHSLGLFPALVAAGALTLETAAKLMVERGKLCQQASGGAMVSVAGITQAEAESALVKLAISGPKKPAVAVANAPSLVVVSGEEADLKKYVELLTATYGERAKCRFLQVTNAYHHELMRGAAEAMGNFAAKLSGLGSCSQCLVADNVSGGWLPKDKPLSAEYFKEQMLQPVRFSKNMETLWGMEAGRPLVLLELGGVALKQIVEANLRANKPSRPITTVSLSKHIKDEQSEAIVFGAALAAAWQEGLPINLEAACGGVSGNRNGPMVPTYRFKRTSCWGSGALRQGQTATSKSGVQRLVSFGKDRPNAKLVVYCFPYSGGSSAVFYGWATKAPESCEFVAVELPERGVRCREEPANRLSYDEELRQTAMAIQEHAKGRPMAVMGLSSGAVFALNVVSLLEERGKVEKLVIAARAPPWVAGAETCNDDDSAAEWMLVDKDTIASADFKTKQLPLLKFDLSLDAEGCKWEKRAKVKAPLHVFCGIMDNSFGPHQAHTWGDGMCDRSMLDISFLNGGHSFILEDELRSKVYKSVGSNYGPVSSVETAPAGQKLKAVSSWLHHPDWAVLPHPPAPSATCKLVLFASSQPTSIQQKLLSELSSRDVLVINQKAGNVVTPCKEISDQLKAVQGAGACSVIYSWLPHEQCKQEYGEKLHGHKQLVQALAALQSLGSAQDPALVTILSNHRSSSVAGVALATTQESPTMLCRVLELHRGPTDENDSAFAHHIIREAVRRPAEMERLEPMVVMQPSSAGMVHLAQSYSPLKLPVSASPDATKSLLKFGGTYVITGAFGRIGRTLAKHLATKWNASLILSTRGKVSEELETFRKSLEAKGNRVVIASNTTCSTSEDWSKLFAATQAAQINGVFHLAGKAELKYLNELAEASNDHIVDGEFSPKELAVQSLEKFLSGLQAAPSFVMLFSSMAAILGGYGMGPYSAANRCLDLAAARHAHDKATKWLSLNWDDWSFEYTVEQTAAYTDKAAARSLTPEEGLSIIESVLAADNAPPQILVSTTPLPPKMDEWLHQRARLEGLRRPAASGSSASEQSASAVVAKAFQDVLGLDSPPRPDEEFFNLGGDSVSAGPLLRAIKAGLPGCKVALGISDIFSLQSVERLAAAAGVDNAAGAGC